MEFFQVLAKGWPSTDSMQTNSAAVPFYPHFVRRKEAEALFPADLRTVQPWGATIEEVLASLGPPLADDSWDLRRWMTYAMGPDRWTMIFDLGLVQSVQRQHETT